MTIQKSHSLRNLYRVCPRLLYFRYIAGIQKKESTNSRMIGKIFHESLEQYRKTRDFDETFNKIAIGFANLPIDENIEIDQLKVRSYLMGYLKRFANDFSYDIKTEMELKNESENEVCYVDAVLLKDRDIIFVEDKTTSIFISDDDLMQSLFLDEQIINYFDLSKKNNLDLSQVRYRQTKKSTHKITKKETTQEFGDRMLDLYLREEDRYREVVIEYDHLEEGQLEKFASMKSALHAEIDFYVDVYKSKPFSYWAYNGFSCIGKFGACDFLKVCSGYCDKLSDHFEPNGKKPLDEGEFIYCHAIDNWEMKS